MNTNGYTKLFSSILTSTIWQEGLESKVLWITMLALVNRDGYVSGSVPGLANVAGISVDACKMALKKFEEPDEYSRSQEHEGRRIRSVDGGWELLNFQKYREQLSAEDRREYQRVKQAEYRKRRKVTQRSAAIEGAQEALTEGLREMMNQPAIASEALPAPAQPVAAPDGTETEAQAIARRCREQLSQSQSPDGS